MPGVIHVRHPYHGVQRGSDTAEQALAELEEVITLEGPNTIAAFIIETVTGTNGVLPPPPGYLEGVRALCDKYGILLICDEVMSGFGRTGKWFAVEHYNVVPDILTMAKGLTSAYVPLGAVGIRRSLADHFQQKVFYGGLTYNSHPLGCATALADDPGLRRGQPDPAGGRHGSRRCGGGSTSSPPNIRASVRRGASASSASSNWFAAARRASRWRRSTARRPRCRCSARFFREHGLYTFVRWNTFFTNPPLCITEAELGEAFAIIDEGLGPRRRGARRKLDHGRS